MTSYNLFTTAAITAAKTRETRPLEYILCEVEREDGELNFICCWEEDLKRILGYLEMDYRGPYLALLARDYKFLLRSGEQKGAPWHNRQEYWDTAIPYTIEGFVFESYSRIVKIKVAMDCRRGQESVSHP